MPVKCSFCRKRYERAGAYKTHLRSAHANLDIVLSSTIRNPPADVLTDRGTDLSTPTNPSNTPIQTTNQILPEIQPVVSTTHLMIRLSGNPKQKYSRATRTQSLRNRMIIREPGKPLERLKSISKNAGICARAHWLPLLLQKVSNLHLCSLRAKSQRRGLTITFRMVSQTRHPSAVPLCIRWRIFFDTWIRIARICNGWRDMWRTVREHYHCSIGMS